MLGTPKPGKRSMKTKTNGGPALPLPDTGHNAPFTAAHGQATTVAPIATEERLIFAARPDRAFYRVRAKAAIDASAAARILQCFARNGLIPHLFLATLDSDDELSIEAWLRQGEITRHALNRIVGNIGAVVGVVSTELTCEAQQSIEICQSK